MMLCCAAPFVGIFIVDRKGILIQKIIGPRRWSDPAVFRFFRKIINPSTSKG